MTKQKLDNLVIRKPSVEIYQKVLKEWDKVAKPLGSMGEFERLTARIGSILGEVSFRIDKKAVIVMCADNGIVEENISQSGQEVTRAVTQAMGKGKSSVGSLASYIKADVIPVDIGIAGKTRIEGVMDKKVVPGTKNFLKNPAMSETETLAAIHTGIEMAAYCKKKGYHLLATGEMGIGNTTTASAMTAAMTGLSVEIVTGRGAGLDDGRLIHKREVITEALHKYCFEKEETLRILQTVGGLDIAGMTGLYIGAALTSLPIVMDGVISAVAALAAERLKPGVKEYIIPSHGGREPAMKYILKELGFLPVIDASLALGEGTGAVMMFALLDMAVSLYRCAADFSQMGIEAYQRYEESL